MKMMMVNVKKMKERKKNSMEFLDRKKKRENFTSLDFRLVKVKCTLQPLLPLST